MADKKTLNLEEMDQVNGGIVIPLANTLLAKKGTTNNPTTLENAENTVNATNLQNAAIPEAKTNLDIKI